MPFQKIILMLCILAFDEVYRLQLSLWRWTGRSLDKSHFSYNFRGRSPNFTIGTSGLFLAHFPIRPLGIFIHFYFYATYYRFRNTCNSCYHCLIMFIILYICLKTSLKPCYFKKKQFWDHCHRLWTNSATKISKTSLIRNVTLILDGECIETGYIVVTLRGLLLLKSSLNHNLLIYMFWRLQLFIHIKINIAWLLSLLPEFSFFVDNFFKNNVSGCGSWYLVSCPQ